MATSSKPSQVVFLCARCCEAAYRTERWPRPLKVGICGLDLTLRFLKRKLEKRALIGFGLLVAYFDDQQLIRVGRCGWFAWCLIARLIDGRNGIDRFFRVARSRTTRSHSVRLRFLQRPFYRWQNLESPASDFHIQSNDSLRSVVD